MGQRDGADPHDAPAGPRLLERPNPAIRKSDGHADPGLDGTKASRKTVLTPRTLASQPHPGVGRCARFDPDPNAFPDNEVGSPSEGCTRPSMLGNRTFMTDGEWTITY